MSVRSPFGRYATMSMMPQDKEQWPELPEVDRVYFFVREFGEVRQRANFVRYGDGSASLRGAIQSSFEGHKEAWRRALERLSREHYRFHSTGPLLRMNDFVADPKDPLPGMRQWAQAIADARPEFW